MTIAEGIFKTVRTKRQTGLGVQATAPGAQLLRRKTSTFELKRDTYSTADEIASHQQVISERQGTQMVDGKLSGLLSPGTYADWISQVTRKDFAAGATSGALTNVTAAVTTGAFGTFTRAAGSFLTDGFKVGDVARWAGWATTGTPNNAHNFLITALTASVMTGKMLDNVAVGPKASGDSVTCTVVGKKSYIPESGHTNIYNTIEEFRSDVVMSEVSKDVQVGQIAVKLPGNGNAEIDFTLVGLDQTSAGAPYFTSPTAESTSDVLSTATGLLVLNGNESAIVTNIDFTIDGQVSALDGVVGTNLRPDISRKKVLVKGSFSAFLDSSAIHTLFLNETETSLISVLTSGRTPAADFIGFTMPRIKIQGSAPDDGEKATVRTYAFTALYDFTGGTGTDSDRSTLSVQDSLAP
ncbi:hypothetical protein GTP38_11385 [Duganella sp. FT94W]|uniref:Uncharacterized protein n=1 Tax=Duganella lactea TaxID=2692173 RepID=A0ABW9V5H1_9BURK|nr:phage tail tube protein [Duganella lactea]MYM34939.1 hypothetical protein [Duganella lactea]